MKSLWSRIDDALADEPIERQPRNAALTEALFAWLDDRLCQDDVTDELRDVLPEVSADVLLSAVAAVGRALKQP